MTGVEEEARQSDGHPTCQEFLAAEAMDLRSQSCFSVPSVCLWVLRLLQRPEERVEKEEEEEEGGRRRRSGCKREQQSLNKHKVQLKS